jgi:hypothetical protein
MLGGLDLTNLSSDDTSSGDVDTGVEATFGVLD